MQSTGTNLNAGFSWQGGSAPTTLDVGVFGPTVTSPLFFSGNASWQGIRLESLNNPFSINPGYTLTLGDRGIDTSGGYNFTMTVNNTLMIGVNQTWSIYGAGLNVNGPVINPAANMLVVNDYGPTLSPVGSRVDPGWPRVPCRLTCITAPRSQAATSSGRWSRRAGTLPTL